jgi:hypothetical protein
MSFAKLYPAVILIKSFNHISPITGEQAFRAGCNRIEYNTEEIFRERGGAGIYTCVNRSIKTSALAAEVKTQNVFTNLYLFGNPSLSPE